MIDNTEYKRNGGEGERAKRSIVTEFTDSSRRRLRLRLKEFVRATSAGRLLALTLTTDLGDAVAAKKRLKRWADGMAYAHPFAGVYVLEFNKSGGVHFHACLRYFGQLNTDELRRDAFRRWRRLNPRFCGDAGVLKPVGDPVGWIEYMAKHDEQKCLRGALGGAGLGTHWWGIFGKKLFYGVGIEQLPPTNDDKEHGNDSREAA